MQLPSASSAHGSVRGYSTQPPNSSALPTVTQHPEHPLPYLQNDSNRSLVRMTWDNTCTSEHGAWSRRGAEIEHRC